MLKPLSTAVPEPWTAEGSIEAQECREPFFPVSQPFFTQQASTPTLHPDSKIHKLKNDTCVVFFKKMCV